MRKKIIAICIIGCFILTAMTTVNANFQTKNTDINDDKIEPLDGKPDVRFGDFEKGGLYLFGFKMPKIFTKTVPENTARIINKYKLTILTVESKEDANIESIKLYVNDNEVDQEPYKQGPFDSIFEDSYYVWAFPLDCKLGLRLKWVTYDIRFEAYDKDDNLVENDEMKIQILALRDL